MTDAEKSHLVQAAQNVDELFAAFDVLDKVEGSTKSYHPERLKEKYLQLRMLANKDNFGVVPFNNITRSYGIRAKTMELLFYEIHEI